MSLNLVSEPYVKVKYRKIAGCLKAPLLALEFRVSLLRNAVLCELIQRRGISKNMFRLNHPGGSIGSLLNREQGL